MKHVLFSFILFSCFITNAQFVLKGTVNDKDGTSIPGVKVYLKNTTYGVITNYNGAYFLELPQQDNYNIIYSMVGMKDTSINYNIIQKISILNVNLSPYIKELETVEVSAKKINVAKGVIKNAQKNRSKIANQYTNYVCKTYLKTGLEKEKRTFVNSKSDTLNKDQAIKMNLIESLSISKFIAPKVYHEKIIAHHDYSDKQDITASSPIDYYMDDIITPIQNIKVDPYIFFEKIQDGDFNLYQNMINLPKISEHPITSPIGMQAFTNYRFKLKSIFYDQAQKIYEIQVTPKFKNAPLLKGTLYIIDEIWIIKSFNLSVNLPAMPFFKYFTVIHDYKQIDGFWVPVRREFIYNINDELNTITANTRVSHSDYKFNQDFKVNDFNNEISSYADDAFDKDSLFWAKTRPIQLKETELKYIAEQKIIEAYKTTEHYLDSVDADYNRVTFWDVALNGVGFRNRFKKQEIRIAPIIESINIIGVGGIRVKPSGFYSKQFENAQKIKISPRLDYGFTNSDLKGQLGIEYTFSPLKFGSIKVEGGDMYENLTNQVSAVDFFGRGNSVRNQFIEISHRREIMNGLYGRVKFSYSDRQSIDGLKLASWVDKVAALDTTGTLFQNFNKPPVFERYQISLLEFKMQYRFKQKYIIKNGEKLIIGSEYPEIELTYKQGIPSLFNSEINFNYIEVKISDEINLGNYGDSKWKIISGSFINKENLRFIEHKFFKGSDLSFLSNPLNTHQTLDSTFNTNSPYLQAFYIHHFNGFLLNKIPLINKLKFETIAGASFLLIEDINYSLPEFFIGLERKFKIKNQYLKYGFYYAGRFNNTINSFFRFKIGFDYLNTFTNKWSY